MGVVMSILRVIDFWRGKKLRQGTAYELPDGSLLVVTKPKREAARWYRAGPSKYRSRITDITGEVKDNNTFKNGICCGGQT